MMPNLLEFWGAITWDGVAQVAIVLLTTSASLLVSRRNKWGWILGLAGQPFWFITSVSHRQPGVFVVNIICTITWAYGVYYNWIGNPLPNVKKCPNCRSALP